MTNPLEVSGFLGHEGADVWGRYRGQPGDYREHPWRADWTEAGVASLVKDCQLFDEQDLTDL